MYAFKWTDEYGIFRLTYEENFVKEIRPVFHEELDFFGMDEYWDYPKDTAAPLLWAEGVRRYILNGVCIAEADGGSFYSKPRIKRLTDERIQLHPIDTERLYAVNKDVMLALEQKVIYLIRSQHDRFEKERLHFVCAFSGGKDSLALLDLTAKALAPDEFTVVFSNTGMELSDTLKSVERAKIRWPQLQFEEAQCHMQPSETWAEFGPPAQRLRWCCSVHKSVPTVLKLREITGNYNSRVLIDDGVRAEESLKRASYCEVVRDAKSISQVNCHPLLNWNSAELYCYLLHYDLLLNDAYRYGLTRVGCMVCPMHSKWSEGIINSHYASEMAELGAFIEAYAIGAKSEKEAKSYIDRGGWKARLGGIGMKNGGNRVKENILDNAITFTINAPVQHWPEVAKILGVTVEENSSSFAQRIEGRLFRGHIHLENGKLTVQYEPFSLMDRYVIGRLRGVANKVAYCIGCKACMVQCPTGAFTIQPNGKILIRENLCIHCYKCLSFTDKGCIVADNLRIPEGGTTHMKNINPYYGFGFRQPWLDQFAQYRQECFKLDIPDKSNLGNVQYSALKAFLKDSGLLEVKKKGATTELSVTPLGEKIIQFTAYNPLSWAVIWTNLAYKSAICHWFCLNVKQGASFERDDLVFMLGEQFAKRTRENAVSSLFETFRFSPVGEALQQGMQVEKGFVRVGWEYPEGVALLYALYLYAEKTGRRAFTFSSLVNERNNPDARGMSPSDIFALDVRTFREQVQGLAISFPKYIRVSFISNLDNIILEDFPSLAVLDLADA